MLHGLCSRLLGLTLLVGLLHPAALRAAGLQTLEQGTWEMGRAMVGAGSAADSAATALYNPAAMTLLDEPVATAGVMAILGETRFDQDSSTTISGGNGGMAWLSDNRRLLVASGGDISMYDTETGELRELISVEPGGVFQPVLAPEDGAIYFLRASTSGDIYLLTAEDGGEQ